MVMLTRLLNLLHRRYGLPCNVIGTGSWTSAVYAGNPDVAEVWSFHRHLPFPFEPSWLGVRRALRASAPGPVYVCERHYRQLPRIRRMLRLAGVDPARCVYLSEQPPAAPEHLIDRLMNLGTRTPAALNETDFPVPLAGVVDGPRLHVLARERAELAAWLAAQGWHGRDLILIQPGNHRSMGPQRARWRRLNTDDKWWPLERWGELLRRIHQTRPDALLLLRGSVQEVPMLHEIRTQADVAGVAVVGTDLRRFFALCEAAVSVISVDTGPAHAAAALGAPLVVLYGAENPAHWLPRSPTGSPVIPVGGPPRSSRADQITVEEMFAAWCAADGASRPRVRRLG